MFINLSLNVAKFLIYFKPFDEFDKVCKHCGEKVKVKRNYLAIVELILFFSRTLFSFHSFLFIFEIVYMHSINLASCVQLTQLFHIYLFYKSNVKCLGCKILFCTSVVYPALFCWLLVACGNQISYF